jgi:hypothetical protein
VFNTGLFASIIVREINGRDFTILHNASAFSEVRMLSHWPRWPIRRFSHVSSDKNKRWALMGALTGNDQPDLVVVMTNGPRAYYQMLRILSSYLVGGLSFLTE